MLSRLQKIQKILHSFSLDALFVSNQDNVTYLTGLAGLAANEREAFLLITKKKVFLFTFATCFGLYKNKNRYLSALNLSTSQKLTTYLTEIVQKENLETIGFEKNHLTLSELDSLKKKVKVKFIATEKLIETLRIVKEEKEIVSIRKAAQITDQAFEFMKKRIYASRRKEKNNLSEKDLSLELEFFLKRKAGDTAFSPIVAFDENTAIPHYLPSKNKKLNKNSIILLDFGAKVDGYCSDMTRIIFCGMPESQKIDIYQIVLMAQEKALKVIRNGMKGKEVDKIARNFLKTKDLPLFAHGLGHGVGLAIHEAPRLKSESEEILRENMVFTVEPGVYLEEHYGIRIEDLVVLKKEGIEILSKSPKDLKSNVIF